MMNESDDIKIRSERLFAKRRIHWTSVHAEELIFRHRHTMKAMQLGQPTKVLHSSKITLFPLCRQCYFLPAIPLSVAALIFFFHQHIGVLAEQ